MQNHTNQVPTLLISGTGRSGTTILRKMMECHTQVATIPEFRLLTDPDGIIEYLMLLENGNPFIADQALRRLKKLLDDLKLYNFWSRVFSRFKFIDKISPFRITNRYFGVTAEQHLPSFSEMASDLINSLSDFHWIGQYAGMKCGQNKRISGILGDVETAETACRLFLYRIAEEAMKKSGKTRFLDKNPWSFLHFDRVSRLYPNGKMVHILRDPRDVVASFLKQAWMPSDPRHSALMVKRLMELWWKVSKEVDQSRFMEIRLEDLVQNTEEVLISICSFWEIDFQPKLMTIDLSASNSGRWRKELNVDEQAIINEILSDIISRYDYSVE